jgi:hypothetical protein
MAGEQCSVVESRSLPLGGLMDDRVAALLDELVKLRGCAQRSFASQLSPQDRSAVAALLDQRLAHRWERLEAMQAALLDLELEALG